MYLARWRTTSRSCHSVTSSSSRHNEKKNKVSLFLLTFRSLFHSPAVIFHLLCARDCNRLQQQHLAPVLSFWRNVNCQRGNLHPAQSQSLLCISLTNQRANKCEIICDKRQSRLLLLRLQQRCIDNNSFVNKTFLDAGVDMSFVLMTSVGSAQLHPPVAVVIFDCVFPFSFSLLLVFFGR